MPGRSYVGSSGYRYGFNGKEKDDEVSGAGNQYDYGFRIYSPRLGKFLSVDPLTKEYPWYTPYQFAGNKPIWAIDRDGLEEYYTTSGELIGKYGTSSEIRVVYDKYVAMTRTLVSNDPSTPSPDVLNSLIYNKGSAGVYENNDKAAIGWAEQNNGKSINAEKEYASNLYKITINCEEYITYTEPNEGGKASSDPNSVPENAERTGSIHSHSNYDEDYVGEEFSVTDLLTARTEKIQIYASTPSGKLITYDPKSEQVYNPNSSPGNVKAIPASNIPSDPSAKNRSSDVSPDPKPKVKFQ